MNALTPANVKARAVVLAEAALTAAITGELETLPRLGQCGSHAGPQASAASSYVRLVGGGHGMGAKLS